MKSLFFIDPHIVGSGIAKTQRKQRIPQLKHTTNRNIGWHCSYRDPAKGTPRKKVFGMVSKGEAEVMYHQWLAEHLGADSLAQADSDPLDHTPIGSEAERPRATRRRTPSQSPSSKPESSRGGDNSGGGELGEGCLLLVANSLIEFDRTRVREAGTPRTRGTISKSHFEERRRNIKRFLRHLNNRHGQGCLTRMTLADLLMSDVESYNRDVVDSGHSASVVRAQMQAVKLLIDRAGRPEFGHQVLPWNWDARDLYHGKAQNPRKLPSLEQLQKMLGAADLRGKTLIWMGIGLGFGQSDLAATCIRHIDAQGYDLRRGKTGVDRYGDTPPLVWSMIQNYLSDRSRSKKPCQPDDFLFTTSHGHTLVHGGTDTVKQWWNKLREQTGESKHTLDGFYTLRHLGATEFGSRPGTSISTMKRWLGHSATSQMADVYMRPVTPEHREVVEYVRLSLASPQQRAVA